MDSLWWDGISEGVEGVNKAKQIPHCVRDDTLEQKKSTELKVRHYKGKRNREGGEMGVGGAWGMVAGNFITVKVNYISNYHSNETPGSRGVGRSWREIWSLVRQ
jgi:hypothetical protein